MLNKEAWVPSSMILPWSKTKMRSMRERVERRWAITIVVRFCMSFSRLSWIYRSVTESKADVASSKMRMGASARIARAMASFAFRRRIAWCLFLLLLPRSLGDISDELVAVGKLCCVGHSGLPLHLGLP